MEVVAARRTRPQLGLIEQETKERQILREGPHWHEPSVLVAQDSVDANCNHGCSRQIWCNGRERPILMSRKSEKSIHDTLLIEQKLNYQLRVVNFVCTRGFLYFTRRKTKILQRKNLTKVCVFFFFFFNNNLIFSSCYKTYKS